MNKQRGIADGWLYLIGLIVLLGLAYAGVKLVTTYLDNIDKRGYERGSKEERAAYAQRDNDALTAALKRVKVLEAAVRAKERQSQDDQARIAQQREREMENEKTRMASDMADARNGVIVLRDPKAERGTAACAVAVGGGTAGKAGTAAAVSNGAEAGKLSREATGFLLAIANEADAVVNQLAACQAVTVTDRKTINSP